MRTRDLLKTTLFAALAAAPLVAASAQSASAQKVVAATCPDGYTLNGRSCVRTGPAPSCPAGYTFSAGKCVTATRVATTAAASPASSQWAFITRDAFGVKNATELDGANFCALAGNQANDAKKFFEDNSLNATHVKVDNNRAGIKKYQKYDCDILVVADRVASSTAKSLEPKDGHIVLPEKFGQADEVKTAPKTPAPAVMTGTPAPLPPKQPATVKKQPAKTKTATTQQSKPRTVRRKRCSAVRYGYTSGNTCKCAGGRVFTGSRCVKPRRF